MKIVYIYKSFAKLAGTERVLADKINYLINKGFDVYLITYEQGKHHYIYNLDPRVHKIDLNSRFFSLGSYSIINKIIKFYKMKKQFKKKLNTILSHINPDIIICTTYSMLILNDIFRSAKMVKCKIVESHISIDEILKSNQYSKLSPLFYISWLMDYKVLKLIKRNGNTVVLTNREARLWATYEIKPIVISNPTTHYPKEIEFSPNNNCIICVGRLEHQKGFDLLIKAWSKIYGKFKNWHIDIYGEGYLELFLNKLIVKHIKNDSIKIYKPSQNIFEKYNSADFLVLSSRAEGFGLVLAEAMSCGRPCVSFNCPCGPDEIITDGVDGLLAKNGDVDDLAEKIEWMITHDKERKEMGIRARESAKRYDKEKIMTQWINLFNELTNNTNI